MVTALAILGGSSAWAEATPDTGPPICEAPEPGEPIYITEECIDPKFNDGYAFIDIDEVRQVPIPHRFVYGGFRGTDLRFAFYFPAADQYEGRFVHGAVHQLRLTGEVAFPQEIQFAFDSGAYLVETNNGGTDGCLTARDGARRECDPTIIGYRAAAAAAKFSKVVAQEIYGYEHRPYGYIFGGSGGAYQTIASAENTHGVWDGFAPLIMGDPQALVAHFAIRTHAIRVLGDKLDDVVDAMDPGGSGDPYATLNADQAAALREITRFGFPLRGWFNWRDIAAGGYMVTADYVRLLDPTYVEDFWTKPGYLGTEQSTMGDAIRAERIRHNATVLATAPANPPSPAPALPWPSRFDLGPAYPYASVAQYTAGLPPKAFVLDSLPDGDLAAADLVATSGPVAGQSCPLSVLDDERNLVQCGGNSDPDVITGINAGDTVRIDNSFALAFQTQPRHELPPADWGVYSYDQYRKKNGKPIYPQRHVSPGVLGTMGGSGNIADGEFTGKMMVINTLLDQDAYPFPADWYRREVAERVGARKVDDVLRVYFIDHATHVGVPDPTRTVDPSGVYLQAVRDLAAWVEDGTAPPASTRYTIDDQTQVQVPATGVERKGLQPVVNLTVAGGDRVEIGVNDSVELVATVEAPPGTGQVVCVEWDPEGSGQFAGSTPLSGLSPVLYADPTGIANQSVGGSRQCAEGVEPAEKVTVSTTHTYTEPGTYFAVVRGTTQRDANPDDPHTQMGNIARVRIVVS